jgi:hypothetical protein
MAFLTMPKVRSFTKEYQAKLSLYSTVMAYGGLHVQLHISFTSAIFGASRPGRITPGKDQPIPTGYEDGCAPEPRA